jgi:alanine racemase
VNTLETSTATTPLRAVVSLGALRENLALIRRALPSDTELIACVKANAYGHGLRGIATCLAGEGVRWLSLGSTADALGLRRWGIACDILLFPTGLGGHPAPLLEAGITVSVQSFDEAAELARAARSRPSSIFLKVDSGLGRVGAPLGEAVALAARIRTELPETRLAGVFTHLPFGGPDSVTWVDERLAAFGRVAAEIRAATPGPLLVQALASAGVASGMKAPEANAVCPGSLLYGIEPAWLSTPFGTRPVLTEVRTALETIRALPPGTRFGYGGARVAARATRLGALPIGYSSSILLPKAGQKVRVAGHEVPVLSVSLEHAVVDLSDVAGARLGDPVCLVAADPSMGPMLSQVASQQGRTPLEILVSLTGRAAYEYSDAEPAAASAGRRHRADGTV